MQSDLTFSIGIPAYNEAANIGRLVHALLNQQIAQGRLQEIIVISDGSSDATAQEVEKIIDKRVRVIVGTSRLGQAARQNQLFSMCQSDVLILLNADILPTSDHFLSEMLKPFIEKPATGLVGAKVTPVLAGSTLVSVVLNWNSAWKTNLFEKINHKDNIFLCHGRARAFSKKLYSQLRWPSIQGEDAYSYIYAKTHGFDFVYAPNASVWYVTPKTLADHVKQSTRFMHTMGEASDGVGHSLKHNWYHIPKYALLTSLIQGICTRPLHFVAYCLIMMCVFGNRVFQKQNRAQTTWDVSESTKHIALEH